MVRKEKELTFKQWLRAGSWRVPFFFSLEKHLADPSGVPVQYIPGHQSARCHKQGISLKRKVFCHYSGRFVHSHPVVGWQLLFAISSGFLPGSCSITCQEKITGSGDLSVHFLIPREWGPTRVSVPCRTSLVALDWLACLRVHPDVHSLLFCSLSEHNYYGQAVYFPFPDCKGFARALIHAKLDTETALGDLRAPFSTWEWFTWRGTFEKGLEYTGQQGAASNWQKAGLD